MRYGTLRVYYLESFSFPHTIHMRKQPISPQWRDRFPGDDRAYILYTRLVIHASNADRRFGSRILHRGQVRYTAWYFAKLMNLSPSGVDRISERLQNDFGKISFQSTNKWKIVSILSYDDIVSFWSEEWEQDENKKRTKSVWNTTNKSKKSTKSEKTITLNKDRGRKASKPAILSIEEFREKLTADIIADLSAKHLRIDIDREIERCWNRKLENGKPIRDAKASLSNWLLKAEDFKGADDQKEASYWRDFGWPATREYVKSLSIETAARLKQAVKNKVQKTGPKSITLERIKNRVFFIENPEEYEKAKKRQQTEPSKEAAPPSSPETLARVNEMKTQLRAKFWKVIV